MIFEEERSIYMGQIYKITNSITGESYIGQTKYKAINRYNAHMNTYKNTRFYNSIHKYGPENFTLEILEDSVKEEDLDRLEIYYIALYDTYNNGYNETIGGQGMHGYVFTEEDRLKKSLSMKETWKHSEKLNNPMRNLKISKANKGKPKSKEHKKKLSERAKARTGEKNPFYGKTHSSEVMERIKQSHIGCVNGKRQVDMFSCDMQFIRTFDSITNAAKYLKNNLNLACSVKSIYNAIGASCKTGQIYENHYFEHHKV